MIKMQRITDRETIGGEYLTIVPTPAMEHAIASATPASVRSTSHQPVKRFSRFQRLWP